MCGASCVRSVPLSSASAALKPGIDYVVAVSSTGLQVVQFDPSASASFAFSRGLQLRLGN